MGTIWDIPQNSRKREEHISPDGKWRSFPKVPNLLQYANSGNYYGRIKVGRKLIRESLRISVWTPAKLRLVDFTIESLNHSIRRYLAHLKCRTHNYSKSRDNLAASILFLSSTNVTENWHQKHNQYLLSNSQNCRTGRKSGKHPTLVVGKKPYGKYQMKASLRNCFLLPLLIAGLSLILADRLTAQIFTTLHSFDPTTEGAWPMA